MRIAQYSRGFLALIGAKTEGRSVSECAEVASPVLSLDAFLGCNVRLQQFAFLDPIVAGFGPVVLTVPPNEVWRVKAGHLSVGALATFGVTNCAILVVPPESPPNSLASRYFLASQPINMPAAPAGGSANITPWLWPDLILNGGTNVHLFATAIVGGGGAGNIQGHISLYTEVLRG